MAEVESQAAKLEKELNAARNEKEKAAKAAGTASDKVRKLRADWEKALSKEGQNNG